MKVKVCGMTSIGQLKELEKLEVDFAGFIFYAKSGRFIDDKLVQHKEEIARANFKRVGVFVNASVQDIKQNVREYGLDFVQLHGDESVEDCKELQQVVSVIKAIRISDATNLDEQLKKYEDACDYFLFDTKGPSPSLPKGKGDSSAQGQLVQESDGTQTGIVRMQSPSFGGVGEAYGGTGKQFDWSVLQNADITKPFFLSGGIGPEDIEKLKAFKHPGLFALDVNSRFETAPGIKNIEKVKQFIDAIK